METHRWRIMEKLDLHSTAELVLSAVRRGMVTSRRASLSIALLHHPGNQDQKQSFAGPVEAAASDYQLLTLLYVHDLGGDSRIDVSQLSIRALVGIRRPACRRSNRIMAPSGSTVTEPTLKVVKRLPPN